jgi:hypothetical protein
MSLSKQQSIQQMKKEKKENPTAALLAFEDGKNQTSQVSAHQISTCILPRCQNFTFPVLM